MPLRLPTHIYIYTQTRVQTYTIVCQRRKIPYNRPLSTLSNSFRVRRATSAGSSLWMKWPQPFAITGPSLLPSVVSFARPALYSAQAGFT